MITAVEMPGIQAAIDAESSDWLDQNHPQLYEAIANEVGLGRDPEQIYRFVLKATNGRNAGALADRCRQTARHLQREQ